MPVKAKVIFKDNDGAPPVFNWKALEEIPGAGKYLILNMAPNTGSLFISTGLIPENVTAGMLADYLKWAIAWCEFPDIEYELIPEEKELA